MCFYSCGVCTLSFHVCFLPVCCVPLDPLNSDHAQTDEEDKNDHEKEIDTEVVDQEEEKDLKEENSPSPVASPKKDGKDSKKDESDEDSFFSQPIPKSEPAVNLTRKKVKERDNNSLSDEHDVVTITLCLLFKYE